MFRSLGLGKRVRKGLGPNDGRVLHGAGGIAGTVMVGPYMAVGSKGTYGSQ